jgi:hypothetical protein
MGTGNELRIDSLHCRAICDEIGERLRIVLDRESTALPQRLQLLMARLAEQDLLMTPSMAPSIAPSMDDMVWRPAPTEDMPGSMRAA